MYACAWQVSKEAGLYLTLFGLLLGFLSTFWAFGYTRLAAKLRQGVNEPEKTPTRATVKIIDRSQAVAITDFVCIGDMSMA